ncbi:hypothetical protein FRB98_007353 [Tulasnella sp. 332]|nr:hypothetical protein FRB98_007353 [Tulasnella sp. 332]
MAGSMHPAGLTVRSITSPSHNRPYMHLLSTIINLWGVTIVTWALSRRTASYSCSSLLRLSTWKDYSWPRLCVVLVFMNSWVFLIISGSLISGTGLSFDATTCALGIYICIVLYASSKILIYAFLIEKVWIVWAHRESTTPPTGIKNRWRSSVWRVCIMLLIPYLCILFLMLYGKIAVLRPADHVCDIGLQKFASLPLLSFDLFITFFLTALFVYPLRTSSLISPELRKVASRTLLSSAAALATSAVNIAVLTFLHGHERGWVCLTSCASDVTINALVLFWVTTGTSVSSRADSIRGVLNQANSTNLDCGLGGISGDNRKRNYKPICGSSVRRAEDGFCLSDDEDVDLGKEVQDARFRTQRHRPTSDRGIGLSSLPPCDPSIPLPASALTRGWSRPTTGASNKSRGSGVVVIRPRSSGMQSLSTKNSSPTLFTMITTEQNREQEPAPQTMSLGPSTSEGGIRVGARAFLQGLGAVMGAGGNARKSEGGQEMNVQVTITTENSVPDLRQYGPARDDSQEVVVDLLGALEMSDLTLRAITRMATPNDRELQWTPPLWPRSESF